MVTVILVVGIDQMEKLVSNFFILSIANLNWLQTHLEFDVVFMKLSKASKSRHGFLSGDAQIVLISFSSLTTQIEGSHMPSL